MRTRSQIIKTPDLNHFDKPLLNLFKTDYVALFFQKLSRAKSRHFKGADGALFADDLAHSLFDEMEMDGMGGKKIVVKAGCTLIAAPEFEVRVHFKESRRRNFRGCLTQSRKIHRMGCS